MKKRFLLILMAALYLTGCSPAGFQGQTTVIVVTATMAPAAPVTTQATATAPAAQNPPAAQPTNTTAPANNAVPAAAPTNTQAPAAAANPTPQAVLPATGTMTQISVNQLLDYNVVDASGNPLGKVKDVVVNRGAANSAMGQIPYLVVESAAREDWLIPVPWKNVQFRPELQAVVLPANAAQLMNAPGFNKDLWPASFAAQQAALQNFWANPGATAAPAAPLTQAGSMAQATDYIRGDDLMSIDFLTPQGVKLGKIKDIAVDWQNSQPGSAQAAQFGYVLVKLDDNISPTEAMVPVPWRLVNPMPGQDKLVLNIAPNILQTAPNFANGMVLPNLYGEPLNTQLNTFWNGK